MLNHQRKQTIYKPNHEVCEFENEAYKIAHDKNFEKTIFEVKYKFSKN
jgi:hypothetical protein